MTKPILTGCWARTPAGASAAASKPRVASLSFFMISPWWVRTARSSTAASLRGAVQFAAGPRARSSRARSGRAQRFGESRHVLRAHADQAAARAVDVRDEKKGDRHDQRQDHEQHTLLLEVVYAVADEPVAAHGDDRHQDPSRCGDPVPPRRLRVALR